MKISVAETIRAALKHLLIIGGRNLLYPVLVRAKIEFPAIGRGDSPCSLFMTT